MAVYKKDITMQNVWFMLLFLVSLSCDCMLADDEDDYDTITDVTSLTSPEKPSVYIENNCPDNHISCARHYRCWAFSQNNMTLQWLFKPCTNDSCTFESRYTTQIDDGFLSSTSIEIDVIEIGYLKCVANTSEHSFGYDQYDVTPLNNTDQRYIEFRERNFDYRISPNRDSFKLNWDVQIEGHPTPNVTLVVNEKYVFLGTPQEGIYTIDYNIFKNEIDDNLDNSFYLIVQNIYQKKRYKLSFVEKKKPLTTIEHANVTSTSARIICSAISLEKPNITWYFQPCLTNTCPFEPLKSNEDEEMFNNTAVPINEIEVNSSMAGVLKCVATNTFGESEKFQRVFDVSSGLEISAYGATVTQIDATTKRLEAEPFKEIMLSCGASLHNHSSAIEWKFGNKVMDLVKLGDRVFSDEGSIRLRSSQESFFGTYTCTAWTTAGVLEFRKIQVVPGGKNDFINYTVGILIAIVVLILIFVAVKMKHFKKLRQEMQAFKLSGLANFEKGAVDRLNKNLSIVDQADLLPYDKNYEFAVEKLKLGEQIGCGAFGVVLKAEAEEILNGEDRTTVAVKMVNQNVGDMYIKALASELKIMIHLGKHVNIVNLLGACTQNIAKRELFVIVEYCTLGNLHNFLLNNRSTFINQINTETDSIDFKIGSEIIGPSYLQPPFWENGYLKTTASSTSKADENDTVLSKTFCTRDLLLWSFQVTRGMEYLSSRKVIHGDLAARNILLTDGNVVKICDFGLAKNVYHNSIYKKKGDEMLPVKWMAIESITDKLFSVQSDVWSFGVVLWEIFSLGKTPYPGLEYNEHFCEKLLSGYRMQRPQYATQETYEMMLHCWTLEPGDRPNFTDLSQKIGCILDETIRNHYIDMNDGYLKMNATYFKTGDYLSMVRSPDIANILSYGNQYAAYANVVVSDAS